MPTPTYFSKTQDIMIDSKTLDNFEATLEQGLYKVCDMSGVPATQMGSEDIDAKWEEFLQHYVADAVQNINDFPKAAIGFAAYLGMAVANQWDKDWAHYKDKRYKQYYGDRGFDNMDDHIVEDILHLNSEQSAKLTSCILNCAQATLDLLRHEQIEMDTETGFYVLVRCYGVMFRLGEAIELSRLGYKKQIVGGLPS